MKADKNELKTLSSIASGNVDGKIISNIQYSWSRVEDVSTFEQRFQSGMYFFFF